MDYSTPGLPVHHQLPEFTQTHVRQVGDAIQSSHSLLSPSLPDLNLSQHQGLFQWVRSSHQVAKVLEFQLQHQSFQWIFRTDNKESHKRKFYSRRLFIIFFHWYQQMIQRWMRIISNFPILPKKYFASFVIYTSTFTKKGELKLYKHKYIHAKLIYNKLYVFYYFDYNIPWKQDSLGTFLVVL